MKNLNLITLKVCKEKSIPYSNIQINHPTRAVRIIKKFISYTDRELFGVLMLNSVKEVNAVEIVSIGTLKATIVSPR